MITDTIILMLTSVTWFAVGLIWGIGLTLRKLRSKPMIGKKGTYYFTKSESEQKNESEQKK